MTVKSQKGKNCMRVLSLTCLILLLVACVYAQPASQEDDEVISQRAVLQVAPLLQRWSLSGASFHESSVVLSIYQPLSRAASVAARASFASAGGDVTSLSGLNDIQLSGNYYWESANLVVGLAVGIPTGTKKLSIPEFQTSSLIAENLFRFQVPNFGSGFNISPSLTWALPLSEEIVLGVGAAYQYRGEYTPIDNAGNFKPGSEILGTFGMDVRIGEVSSLAFDILYSRYGKDQLNGADVFGSGDKIRAVAQFKTFFGSDELTVLATFRSKAKAEAGFGGSLSPLNQRLTPNQGELLVAYGVRFSPRVSAQFAVEGRFFEKTPAQFSGYTLVGIGAFPSIALSEDVSLPIRLRYMHGSAGGGTNLNGFEAGAGLAVRY